MTEDEILRDFPYLEKEDFQAVYESFGSIPDGIAVLVRNLSLMRTLRQGSPAILPTCFPTSIHVSFRGVGQDHRRRHLGICESTSINTPD